MGKYWFEQYRRTGDAKLLGHVMHALQDATLPQHATGRLGDWHSSYEKELIDFARNCMSYKEFKRDITVKTLEWWDNGAVPPKTLSLGHHILIPGRNWQIDMLITWLALNACREIDKYRTILPKLDEPSARNLLVLATAMSILVLRLAAQPKPVIIPARRPESSCSGFLKQFENFHAVLPSSKSGFHEFYRDNSNQNYIWYGPKEIPGDPVDAITMIRSTFGRKGNFEVVVRRKSKLDFYWRDNDLNVPTWNIVPRPERWRISELMEILL